MNTQERYVARVIFQLKVVRAHGQAYEDLFTKVMSASVPGFRSVKPQGKVGDRKNDGWVQESGMYYQVYAPEDPAYKVSAAVAKLENDFKGLKAYWDPISLIREFYFAFNDKYSGAYPTIEASLAKLLKAHSLMGCGPFYAKHLEDKFVQLAPMDIMMIVGLVPDPSTLESLEYSPLTEVLQSIVENTRPTTVYDAMTVLPEFERKITFNGMSPAVGGWLRQGSWQREAVEQYFLRNSQFARKTIRDRLFEHYTAAVEATVALRNTQYPGDSVFFELLEMITPPPSVASEKHRYACQQAAVPLIAYFFETCDVFEEPPRHSQEPAGEATPVTKDHVAA